MRGIIIVIIITKRLKSIRNFYELLRLFDVFPDNDPKRFRGILNSPIKCYLVW
jgi:hypothetical protein